MTRMTRMRPVQRSNGSKVYIAASALLSYNQELS